MTGDMIYTAVFYLLSGLILTAAAGVVLNRNLVHSALLLALTFIGVAGLYILLAADFLAAVQILVYNGAVAVLVVIGVMLTQQGDMANSNPVNRLGIPAAVVTGGVIAVLVFAVMSTPWKLSGLAAPHQGTAALAAELLTDYVVPFEVAAVLLLAAMIGAIILAKGVDE